jgi:hypothetical protein
MKRILLGLGISVALALPAFAQVIDAARHHAAPAPLIGAGIPALIVVGGVLLGRKLLNRKRK